VRVVCVCEETGRLPMAMRENMTKHYMFKCLGV
jgi:hypothetical protein